MADKTKKITLTQQFQDLLTIPEIANSLTRKAFIEGRIAQLAKKNASGGTGDKKLTATQTQNLALKNAIYEGMVYDSKYTVTDLMKQITALDGLSNQKVNALVTQMVAANIIVRVEDKRKAYFVKPTPETTDEEEA